MRNKIIVVEGTDCSGKQTQTELLVEDLKSKNIFVTRFSFPNYNSPTGKIVGGPYLGKPHICEGYFSEGATNVNPKVAGLYYAADRLYNLPYMNELLSKGHLVLDRYIDSNIAHQGGKITDKKQRKAIYKWFENIEYKCLGLPKADIRVLLYMPYEYSLKLRIGRQEMPDQHELDATHLKNAEHTYLEIAKRNKYKIIDCVKDGQIRDIDDIHKELTAYVLSLL